MHILPQLRKLEEKYRAELSVIGVHTAKFPTEKGTENVRQAVQRYEVAHPVLNDADFQVWNSYAVRAWPTLIFVDPQGKILARHEGEFELAALDRALQQLIGEYDSAGLLKREPLPYQYVKPARPASALNYPGKVLADPARQRLFISDTSNHRVLEADFDGKARRVFGAGQPGMEDGPADRATFRNPQGLALNGEKLYVADTENHAIREIDLGAGVVTTIAGLGNQSLRSHDGGEASGVALNSPWDLALLDQLLFIAMAGFHQIWVMDLQSGEIRPFLGAGREGIEDGPGDSAWLAQPSGLAVSGDRLYWVDSETSSVRMANLQGRPEVRTIVGQDLFVFGDEDGVGDQVRLQHPLAITVGGDELFIADSYNHKIKRVFPRNRGCLTYLGDGQPGLVDGVSNAARFYEPGGLSAAGDLLFIADTNNHQIRVADLKTQSVRTLPISLV